MAGHRDFDVVVVLSVTIAVRRMEVKESDIRGIVRERTLKCWEKVSFLNHVS